MVFPLKMWAWAMTVYLWLHLSIHPYLYSATPLHPTLLHPNKLNKTSNPIHSNPCHLLLFLPRRWRSQFRVLVHKSPHPHPPLPTPVRMKAHPLMHSNSRASYPSRTQIPSHLRPHLIRSPSNQTPTICFFAFSGVLNFKLWSLVPPYPSQPPSTPNRPQ